MRPKKNREIVWRMEEGLYALAWEKARNGEDFEDFGVLTLMMSGAIHRLNLVGAEVWTRINGVSTAEGIAAAVAPLFGADPEDMLMEVEEFLRDIEEKGWISRAAGPSASAPGWTKE